MNNDATTSFIRWLIFVWLVALYAPAAAGCGGGDDDDDDNVGGSGGSGGGGAAVGGGGGPVFCPDEDPPYDPHDCVNLKCPEAKPLEGPYAKKGGCCFRTDNARIMDEANEGELMTLSFVESSAKILTQSKTLGSKEIQDFLGTLPAASGETLLIRIEGVPRREDGAGKGPVPVEVTMGGGAQNCDGTYSFYGKGAAPDNEGRTDSDRWNAAVLEGTFDWDRDPHLEIDPSSFPTGVRWAPRWSGFAIDEILFELPTIGYRVEIPNDSWDEQFNCVGTLDRDKEFHGVVTSSAFVPLEEADQAVVKVAGQTLCSIFAQPIGESEPGVAYTCDPPRVGGKAPWLELPTGYCDDGECWIGDPDDPDYDSAVDCDPDDADPTCCDPEAGDTNLPACNAYRVKMEVVWAAVTVKESGGDADRITDPAGTPPSLCGN